VSIDISGRGSFHMHTGPKTKWIEHPALREKKGSRDYTLADAKHFWESFASHMGLTLHVDLIAGEQSHHIIEATFKALAKALDWATGVDARMTSVPSANWKLFERDLAQVFSNLPRLPELTLMALSILAKSL
jgi:imidazoleglycerol-phosphate dehydratase